MGATWQLLTIFLLWFARTVLGRSDFLQRSVPIHLTVKECGPRVDQVGIFLCPACRYVHGYAAPDIQLLLPHTDPHKAGTSYNVVYIRLECEVQGCASILRIRTLMAIDKVPHKEAPRLRVATDIYCAAPLRLTVWLSTHNVTRIGRSETVGIGGCDSALKSARVRLLKGFLWRWVNGRRVLTYLLILGCCVCVVPLFQRSEVPFDNLFNS